MNNIPEFDGIIYDIPSPAAPTSELERAVRELKELPPTPVRKKDIELIERELADRAQDTSQLAEGVQAR